MYLLNANTCHPILDTRIVNELINEPINERQQVILSATKQNPVFTYMENLDTIYTDATRKVMRGASSSST